MKAIYPTCQHIDLIHISEILDHDHELVVKMLNEFMDMTQVDIQRIQEAFVQKDLEVVANIAHKFRSTFAHFGVKQGEGIPSELEIVARSTGNRSTVKPILDEFVQCCCQMMAEIQGVLKIIDPSLPK